MAIVMTIIVMTSIMMTTIAMTIVHHKGNRSIP